MRQITYFLIIFLLLTFISCSKSKDETNPSSTTLYNSEISGTVYKQDCCFQSNPFYPLQGAGVELFKSSTLNMLKNTTTDQNGMYYFKQLSAGSYDVVAVIPSNTTLSYPETRLNNSNWESTTYDYLGSSCRITRAAVNVADNESVVVDFRFMGY